MKAENKAELVPINTPEVEIFRELQRAQYEVIVENALALLQHSKNPEVRDHVLDILIIAQMGMRRAA